jgi:hypothetical protein
MRRIKKWGTALGILAGLLVWVYDYEFFLNAGGPAAPISTAITKISGLENADMAIIVFWPLFVLVMIGAILGFVLARAANCRGGGGSVGT